MLNTYTAKYTRVSSGYMGGRCSSKFRRRFAMSVKRRDLQAGWIAAAILGRVDDADDTCTRHFAAVC